MNSNAPALDSGWTRSHSVPPPDASKTPAPPPPPCPADAATPGGTSSASPHLAPRSRRPHSMLDVECSMFDVVGPPPHFCFQLSAFPLSAFPLSAFPLSVFPLSVFQLSAFPLSAFQLSAFQLSAFQLFPCETP